jgi:pimeloyl-ACP methyl ester carboxylesterase
VSVTRSPFRLELPGAELRGDYWSSADGGAGPRAAEPGTSDAALVVCHGFKGFKDWGFFPWVSEMLAARTGLPVVSFNFDGSGVRDATETFDDLPAFARNTFTRELFDLEAVLDGLAVGRLGDLEVEPAVRFGLLGHSRGGATCVLKAAVRRQVRALVTWASIASADRYRVYEAAWDAGEDVAIPNARTGQDMPLHRNVLDDLRANRERLDVLESARTLAIPWAVVHGDADVSVPFADAETLAGAAGTNARVVRIEGAGHTFETGHPFTGSTPELDRAVDSTVGLFQQVFGGGDT